MAQMTQVAQRVLREAPQTLSVRTPDFEHARPIPREYSAHGDDVSPAIEWGNSPADTRAHAIIVDDPDAPGGVFTHWLAWNLPAAERGLPRAADLKGIGAREGVNDYGRKGYGGPKPPSGTHRYYFRVFALSSTLDLPETAKASDVWNALEGKVLAWGETMGTFTRP